MAVNVLIRSVDICLRKYDAIESNANSIVTNMERQLERNSWRKFLNLSMSGNEETGQNSGRGE